MGQFHLQPALLRAGPFGKNVQNHFAAVEHLHADGFFEVLHLGRREIVIEHHHVRFAAADEFAEFLELAGADVGGEVDVVPLLRQFADDAGSGRLGEAADLIAGIVRDPGAGVQGDAHEHGFLGRDGERVAARFKRFADGTDSCVKSEL